MASAAAEAEPWWDSYDESGRAPECESPSAADGALSLQLERAHTQLRAKTQLLALAEEAKERLAAELSTLQSSWASQQAVAKAELQQERLGAQALRAQREFRESFERVPRGFREISERVPREFRGCASGGGRAGLSIATLPHQPTMQREC